MCIYLSLSLRLLIYQSLYTIYLSPSLPASPHVSIDLSHLSLYLPPRLRLFIYLSIQSICLSLSLSASSHPSIYLSNMSISLLIHVSSSIYLSIHLINLPISPSLPASPHPSINLSLHPSPSIPYLIATVPVAERMYMESSALRLAEMGHAICSSDSRMIASQPDPCSLTFSERMRRGLRRMVRPFSLLPPPPPPPPPVLASIVGVCGMVAGLRGCAGVGVSGWSGCLVGDSGLICCCCCCCFRLFGCLVGFPRLVAV